MMQALYGRIGGDYCTVMTRMIQEERLIKYLKIFLEEGSYRKLELYLAEGNVEEAFRAAHSLKGICQNMSFVRLENEISEITELLRAGNLDEGKAYLPNVKACYEEIITDIKKTIDK